MENPKDVSFAVLESVCIRLERNNLRLFVLCIVLLLSLIATSCIQYCKKNGVGDLNFYDMQLERISEILIQCEYGYISDYEACRLILEA